jgi:hypothetical protein
MSDSEEMEAVSEPTAAELELAKAKEILEPLAKEGKSDDEMGVALVTDGFSFNKAKRLMRRALEDLGVRLSNKDRLAQASELLLANDFAPTEWQEVVDVCEYLAQELEATTEKQALRSVKKFAKEQGIELPEKPKGKGGVGKPSATSYRSMSLAWIAANPKATEKQFVKWAVDFGRPANKLGYSKRILKIVNEAFEEGYQAQIDDAPTK